MYRFRGLRECDSKEFFRRRRQGKAVSRGVGSHFHFLSSRGGKTEQPWKRRCLCGLLGLNISILKRGFLPPNFKTCKMATRRSPPSIGIPNKRRRLSKIVDDQRINEVAVKAAEVLLPLDEVSPPYFSEWWEKFSNAQGATKELMFMSILPTVSSLLGLCKLQMTTTYSENLALFTLAICPPSGGKNQCFSFGCKQPVSYVESKSAACLLLDKFTEVGLRQHLLQNGGVGLLMNEEMEDTLRHIHLERECGTLCRLFDGDSIYINTGSSNSRQEIERSSLAIGGFMQVHYIVTHSFLWWFCGCKKK